MLTPVVSAACWHRPTHDLVLTFADSVPDTVNVDPCGVLYDHALVTRLLPLRRDSLSLAERLMRGWRRVD